jgi:hypothetical protein
VNKIIVRFVSHCHFFLYFIWFHSPACYYECALELSYDLWLFNLSLPFLRYDDKEEGPV